MKFYYFILCFAVLFSAASANPLQTLVQDDTVYAREAETPPVMDGFGSDACWDHAAWQTIDQVWIPWGGSLPAEDFTGRYKVSWSSDTDSVYFLVEIVDDALVKGYSYPDGGWPDWDVVEIFCDEDNSDGDHTHDNNAFAYHITAGNNSVAYEVIDLQQGWDPVDFTHHLRCVIKEQDTLYTWEIAMAVFNESYDVNNASNPTEELFIGKVSGLSLAYCDNDGINEEPKSRDNFIGSVYVPQHKYNDHWQNASDFGTVKFVETDFVSIVRQESMTPDDFTLNPNVPNPFNPITRITYSLASTGYVSLVVYNMQGQKIRTLVDQTLPAGHYSATWNGLMDSGVQAPSGGYLYRLQNNSQCHQRKMMLTR
ncbi:MAG: sugar-binding protein [candidate division KSB1 bacterium]|nr:sugar-binding protein [candidate division KSB1 bacterium]